MKFLDREATIAKPGFNRWLVPPAALAVHLAIGQIYAYSVFNAPLTKLILRLCSVLGWNALGRVRRCSLLPAASAWVFLCRRSAFIRTICFCFIWATV
ncbi:integral membrane transporter [Mycobacteroides abscessus subsp. massiliense]|nr:integral membrane transporter [Mycobacteroides abscessus subsp. massiliense]